MASLIAQRVYGLALGYEDLKDHDALLAVLAGCADPTGMTRRRARDGGNALAGKSTLNRLELTAATCRETERYKKITVNHGAVDRCFVALFVRAQATPPTEIVLDLDATDDPVHGAQEGRFFHGITATTAICTCTSARASICCAHGSARRISTRVPLSRRAAHVVRNARRRLCDRAREECAIDGADRGRTHARRHRMRDDANGRARVCGSHVSDPRLMDDGPPRRRESGASPRPRRVESESRFVVTSLTQDELDAQSRYEVLYCARGDMENRIKEQQLMLFADRTSAATMPANQLRLTFSSVAYTLLAALRRLGWRARASRRRNVRRFG